MLFNFPGRLNCKHQPKPVHVVICALVAMKNVGVSSEELSFHPNTQRAIKSKLQTRATADVVVD